jgi:hypothetical protein
VAHERLEGDAHRDPEAGKAVEEAAAQHVSAEEAPERAGQIAWQRPPAPGGQFALEVFIGEDVDLRM